MRFVSGRLFLLFCFSILLLTGCNKDVQGNLPSGEVALTFDDFNVDNWYANIHVLDSLNIKATFYVCRYHELTSEQKRKLHEIASHGHEIAYHSTNHPDMVKRLKSKGMAEIINEEILKDLRLMRADGYSISHFAYPYGSHNRELDCTMKRYFKTVRKVCNKNNWNKSLVKQSGERQILYGAGIDHGSKISNQGIIDLLDNAQSNHDCVVLNAHEMNNPRYIFSVSTERLVRIAKEAKQRNLEFITIDQVVE
ncbi:MAG: polysaccharide deacetylase family protein [Candidatus Dadabacteria bacterium]